MSAAGRRDGDGDGDGDNGEKQLRPSDRLEHLLRELRELPRSAEQVTLTYSWFAEDALELIERFAC